MLLLWLFNHSWVFKNRNATIPRFWVFSWLIRFAFKLIFSWGFSSLLFLLVGFVTCCVIGLWVVECSGTVAVQPFYPMIARCKIGQLFCRGKDHSGVDLLQWLGDFLWLFLCRANQDHCFHYSSKLLYSYNDERNRMWKEKTLKEFVSAGKGRGPKNCVANGVLTPL